MTKRSVPGVLLTNLIRSFRKPALLALVFSLAFGPLLPVYAQENISAVSVELATPKIEVVDQPIKETVTPTDGTPPIKGEIVEPPIKEVEEQTSSNDIEEVDPEMEPESIISSTNLLGPPNDNLISSDNKLKPEVDQITGALVYEYPIAVPPGRNGMTPDVKLQYNSANADNNSAFGYGWSVNIPFIERINREGTGDLYTSDTFASSLSGELTSLGSGDFAARVEKGDFLKYEQVSDGWEVTDKKGTVYFFGTNAQARQDDGSNIYKWMLEKVVDTNDNYTRYEYAKSDGYIYPSEIYYTGNDATDGVFEIDFTTASRTDVVTTYAPTFEVAPASRVTDITIIADSETVHLYELAYTAGSNGNRSLLSSITETGYDENAAATELPPISFSYQTVDEEFVKSNWDMPLQSTDNWVGFSENTQLVDVNGDGLPDFVQAVQISNSTTPGGVYLNNGSGWTKSNWDMPLLSPGEWIGFGESTQLIDVNGDGLPDFVNALQLNNPTTPGDVYLNNGSGWIKSNWDMPLESTDNWVGFGESTQLIDVNGDGLPDFVQAVQLYNPTTPGDVYLNTGSGWTKSNWDMPLQSTDNWVGFNEKTQLADVNGDDLPDFVQAIHFDTPTSISDVYLNTGSGWEKANWDMPYEGTNSWVGFDGGSQLADVNGDGLPDFVKAVQLNNPTTPGDVYLNNGSGWVKSNWDMPLQSTNNWVGFNEKTQLADVNGDGLPDFVQAVQLNNPTTPADVYLNTGSGWVKSNWDMPLQSTDNWVGLDGSAQLSDVNNDGLLDFVQAVQLYNPTTPGDVYLNTGKKGDYLSMVAFPTGGSIEIGYTQKAVFDRNLYSTTEANRSQFLYVVDSIETNDGIVTSGTDHFSYADGKYFYYPEGYRVFTGFHVTTKTDALGNVTKTYYHQGNDTDSTLGEFDDHESKMGQIYRIEQYDDAYNLYALTVNKWDKYNIGTDHDFIKLVTETDLTYDGDVDHADTATEYTYDNATGNLTDKVEWGTVTADVDGTFTDTGSDERTTEYTYATDGADVVGLVAMEQISDDSAVVKETKYLYDGEAFGDATKGNVTQVDRLVDVSAYVSDLYEYDGTYGLVEKHTDPNGNDTTYVYDTYNLYPESETNELSQVTSYTYDYSSGKKIDTVDVNSQTWTMVYDGLDRVLEEIIPTPFGSDTKTTYEYDDWTTPNPIHRVDFLNDTDEHNTYTYLDGLGRIIQEYNQVGTSSYVLKDTIYDELGRVSQVSLPYSHSFVGYTLPTSTAALYITTTYDPVGRVASVVDAVGTTTYTYDDWGSTVTDANTHDKDFRNDAYRNLIEVTEHDDSSDYTTTYEWNAVGNLTKITDDDGNLRNFTYDKLGNRLTAEDLHASADMTYGVWEYQYDNASNLMFRLDPNAQEVEYGYDELNRVLREDYTSNVGDEIVYVYDTCTNGVGKLCSATTPTSVTEYTYDSLGNVATETVTTVTLPFTTSYEYNYQTQPTLIVYPDTSEVKYTYNLGGNIQLIEEKPGSGGGYVNIVDMFAYSPAGQIFYQENSNGTETITTYDAAKMYRMSEKVTTDTVPAEIQHLEYDYDAVGNITDIADTSTLDSAKDEKYEYDDLNRLIEAEITNTANSANYTYTFAYDALGNIVSSTPVGSYEYAGTSYANPHAATTIATISQTYDNNGNLISVGTSPAREYVYDYQNRIIEVASPSATYTYDYKGNRLTSDDGSNFTISPNKYYESDGGSTHTKYIYAGDLLVATIVDDGSPDYHWVHTDHLGGSTVITDDTSAFEEVLDYYPYGDIRIDDQYLSFNERNKFIGQEYDATTELSYLNARYYEGSKGKFLSQDPMFWNFDQTWLMDPQNQNSYSYARNNPISLSDPTGRSAIGNLIQSVKNAWNSIWNGNTTTYQAPTNSTPTPSQQTASTPAQRTTTWDPVTDQRISQLDPRVQQPATNFINNTESELNVQLRVVQGYRSVDEQNRLYAQGRTEPGNRVTKAKGGESYHNYGLAVDVVKMENGQPNWNQPITPDIAKIGNQQGFSWGGSWNSFKDYPHFEMSFGQSIKSLMGTI